MALEAMLSNDLLNFLIYDTICGNPLKHRGPLQDFHSILNQPTLPSAASGVMLPSQEEKATTVPMLLSPSPPPPLLPLPTSFHEKQETGIRKTHNLEAQGKRKRKRRSKVCKNKEEAETQRITHIVVERNRRKQMNDLLSILRSLMPESYAQRGDQASIVGGAIEYVKELEHLLQSLEAHKLMLLQQGGGAESATTTTSTATTATTTSEGKLSGPPFAEFFSRPQYTWSQPPSKYSCKTAASNADIEVTLIESHANLRILTRQSPRQHSRLVAGFQILHLSILHLNITSLDPLVLYSISAKVEEGCQLSSVDDIAEATHHMLRIIEEEAALC